MYLSIEGKDSGFTPRVLCLPSLFWIGFGSLVACPSRSIQCGFEKDEKKR